MKFIVPQNFKNGRLIMKRYRLFDLVMLISAVSFSLVVFIAVVQSGIGRNGIIFFFAFLLPACNVLSIIAEVKCSEIHALIATRNSP